MLTEHKKVCLNINGTQSVRFEKGAIEFKNYFKQISVPFKIYADFEWNLVLFTSLFVLMINLPSQQLFLEVQMLLMSLLKQFLKSISIVKKIMNKHFNKNLIMTKEEEKQFQSSNTCWISEKHIENDAEKTRKFRDAAHWSSIINIHSSNKVSVIFHNLRKQWKIE